MTLGQKLREIALVILGMPAGAVMAIVSLIVGTLCGEYIGNSIGTNLCRVVCAALGAWLFRNGYRVANR